MPKYFLVLEMFELDGLKPIKQGVLEIPREARPTLVFYDGEKAETHAEKLAAEHPEKLVAIFESQYAIETEKPKVIRKKYTENGELVPE